MDNAVVIAFITFAGTVTAGLFGLLNKLSKSLDKNTESNVQNALAHQEVAKEIKKGNKEAKQRNGHLAELVIQSGEQTKALADGAVSQISEVVQTVGKQEIKEQHVEHQHVEEK